MEDNVRQSFEQAGAFQKMWTQNLAGMAEVWAQFSPEAPPPEELKRMRSGMLKTMTKTLDDYMRTPQFQQTMKQAMDAGLGMKKMAQDKMSELHDEMRTPSKEDIEGILLAIRHIERRILNDVEEVNLKVDKLTAAIQSAKTNGEPPRAKKAPAKRKAKPAAKKTVTKNTVAKRAAKRAVAKKAPAKRPGRKPAKK